MHRQRSILVILVVLTGLCLLVSCKEKPTDPNSKTVATPVIGPAGGVYSTAQTITITCATSDAIIRYTTNGAIPTATSPVYSDTITVTVSSPTTIRAKGFKSGWMDSAIARTYYIIGDLPADMCYVPGGTFTMGDTKGGGEAAEIPTHSVTIGSFYMGKHEVTQAEYNSIMGSNPATGHGVGDNYPVYYVSWYSALKYCNLRSMAEGLTPVYKIGSSTVPATTNPANWGPVPTASNDDWNNASCDWTANGYRLPTEAEWEYAARGASSSPDYLYSGSDDINAVAWYSTNWGLANQASHEVEALAPNGIGAYDMSGNVWEWCWDWYSIYSVDSKVNPVGPNGGTYRLVRGGVWYESPASCRVSYRNAYSFYPQNSDRSYGFRVCRAVTVPAPPNPR